MNKAILRRDLEDIHNSIDVNCAMRSRIILQIDGLDKELLELERHRDRLEKRKIDTMEKLNKEEESDG